MDSLPDVVCVWIGKAPQRRFRERMASSCALRHSAVRCSIVMVTSRCSCDAGASTSSAASAVSNASRSCMSAARSETRTPIRKMEGNKRPRCTDARFAGQGSKRPLCQNTPALSPAHGEAAKNAHADFSRPIPPFPARSIGSFRLHIRAGVTARSAR